MALYIIIISIIAAISWPPPLISQLDFLKAAPFLYSLAVFAWMHVTTFYKTDPNCTSDKIKLTPPVDSYF